MIKKITLKLFKILLITLIILICITSLLQTNLRNNSLNNYSIYQVKTQSLISLKENDLIIIKQTNDFKEQDLIVYIDNSNKENIAQIAKITKENNNLKIYINNNEILENNIKGKKIYKLNILSLINRLISNKTYFLISIITIIVLLILLELINITKKKKANINKKLSSPKIEELNSISNNTEKEQIKEETNITLEKIETKNQTDKIDKTIQIPLEELQNEIKTINQKLNTTTNSKSNNTSLEDTIIIEDTEDLKKQIEKELSQNR